MSSQNDGIARIDIQGLFGYLPDNFSLVDAIKEIIDNSLDSNATHIKVILLPTYFAIADNGNGMKDSIRKEKFLNFFKSSQDDKIGSKGVGAKAASLKLSDTQNMYYFTKTLDDASPKQIYLCHQDVIKNNSISYYRESGIELEINDELKTRKELVYENKNKTKNCFDIFGLEKGTIFYLNNKTSCIKIIEGLDNEAKEAEQQCGNYSDYLMSDISRTYSGYLSKGVNIELITETGKIIIKPCNMFNLDKYEDHKIKYLESEKKCYVKFHNTEKWLRVNHTNKTCNTQFKEIDEKELSPKLLNFELWHYDEDDFNKYVEFTGVKCKQDFKSQKEASTEKNRVYETISGVYGCRHNKFTKRNWKLKKRVGGTYSDRPIYSRSVFVIKTDNTCDNIFKTSINKSEFSRSKESSYLYNSIDCIINRVCAIKNGENDSDEEDVETQIESKVEPVKQSQSDIKPPLNAVSKIIEKKPKGDVEVGKASENKVPFVKPIDKKKDDMLIPSKEPQKNISPLKTMEVKVPFVKPLDIIPKAVKGAVEAVEKKIEPLRSEWGKQCKIEEDIKLNKDSIDCIIKTLSKPVNCSEENWILFKEWMKNNNK